MGDTCVYTTAEDGVCGLPGELYSSFILCEEHQQTVRSRRDTVLHTLADQALKHHPRESFPGICYMVLVPGGNVKIGCSNTEDTYERRIKDLSRELGPVVELLKMPGGFVYEAFLHKKFRQDRLPGTGELFRYSEDIAEFVKEQSELVYV